MKPRCFAIARMGVQKRRSFLHNLERLPAFSEFASMNLSPDQKRAILQGMNISDAEQVFDAVAAALTGASATPQPVAWARPDELERLADTGVNGRSCYLSREKRERCTVPLYPAISNDLGPAKDLVLAAVSKALADTRAAAATLEDVQFRSGMETACDEIEARVALACATGTGLPEK